MTSLKYPKSEPLKYITFVYPNDTTIRFQYLTDDEIKELKSKGVKEVDIGTIKWGGNE